MTDTAPRQSDGRFGQGNPGKPKGARHKLGEAFIGALLADFGTHGVAAIVSVRESDPSTYVRTIAGILPKEVTGENGEALFTGITVNFVKSGQRSKP